MITSDALIDLVGYSAAFDTVDHAVALEILERSLIILQGLPQDFLQRGGCLAPTFLLQCVHVKEKNWCSPNPFVKNNLASSLFNCNKIVNAILSEL